jgi:hypothetical protein
MTATIALCLAGLVIAAGCGVSASVLLRTNPRVAAWVLGATCLVVLVLVALVISHIARHCSIVDAPRPRPSGPAAWRQPRWLRPPSSNVCMRWRWGASPIDEWWMDRGRCPRSRAGRS